MEKTIALLVAAGSGSRVGGDLPKQYRPLAGRPLLAHALDALAHPLIDAVQVVIGEGQQFLFTEAARGARLKLLPPVIGGATRQASVRNGLAAIAGAERVLIHDAARPFLPAAVIDRLVAALDEAEGAVPVLAVVDTLAAQDGNGLGDTVARDRLVRVQTPQAFRYEAITAAHASWRGDDATDDAQVARAAGCHVVTVAGDPNLEKITYEQDFRRMEAMLSGALLPRTGSGFDVHAFEPGDHIWLGGVRIPHDRGLAGHSDADVALHALTDALLGAVAAGDIGQHFPPSDPRWKGAASDQFLEHARDLVAAAGGIIDGADITVICERPKIGPYRDAIRARIAQLLRLSPSRISVKATTTERLGFTGRGEGIAAQAVANVRIKEQGE